MPWPSRLRHVTLFSIRQYPVVRLDGRLDRNPAVHLPDHEHLRTQQFDALRRRVRLADREVTDRLGPAPDLVIRVGVVADENATIQGDAGAIGIPLVRYRVHYATAGLPALLHVDDNGAERQPQLGLGHATVAATAVAIAVVAPGVAPASAIAVLPATAGRHGRLHGECSVGAVGGGRVSERSGSRQERGGDAGREQDQYCRGGGNCVSRN